MKIITKKSIDRFALFLFISGLGASWLTYIYSSTLGPDYRFHGLTFLGLSPEFPASFALYYYIFNSALLILLSYTLRRKRFKIHSSLAVLLGLSVTASLFLITSGGASFESLFYFTVALGMWFTFPGGTILVPMFLVSVYVSAFRGIQYFRGKLTYSLSDSRIENQTETSQVSK